MIKYIIFSSLIIFSFKSFSINLKNLDSIIKIEFINLENDSIVFKIKNNCDSTIIYFIYILSIKNDSVDIKYKDPFRNLDEEDIVRHFSVLKDTFNLHKIKRKNLLNNNLFLYVIKYTIPENFYGIKLNLQNKLEVKYCPISNYTNDFIKRSHVLYFEKL